jgi:hypothetical protein
MTLRRRLCNLEAAMLEQQIARLEAHYRGLPEADLDLIIELADSQRDGLGREFSPDEIALFERHCSFLSQFPDSVQDEHTRRDVAHMLGAGQITRSEVIELFGEKFL